MRKGVNGVQTFECRLGERCLLQHVCLIIVGTSNFEAMNIYETCMIVSGMELDDTDRRILDALLEDARMSFSEIARRIDMSSATVHDRVN